ncbi:hypothetical protein SAMN04487980_1001398 [Streptomyces sp. cf124]|uniref:hypothetical protein n=1 Tax=Streptomyces sp. cf124 TaxID=1761903 RepID=UPI0008EEFF43|nr:hypothetical protein [Streptomyces sp. cf124]SFM45354.1 hypothetical protein SAMN04487980_1001398 [Streptomyces sp. cf124]
MTVRVDEPTSSDVRAHPVEVLWRLRNGVLACIAFMAVAVVGVGAEAMTNSIAADRTEKSRDNIFRAKIAAEGARDDLRQAFSDGNVVLTGTGSGFVNKIGEANTAIALAMEGNTVGEEGRRNFQFVLGQLATSVHLAEVAAQQYDRFPVEGKLRKDVARSALQALEAGDETYRQPDGESRPVHYTGGLIPALDALGHFQKTKAERQRPDWVEPPVLLPLLLGPVLVQLLLAWVTARVLATHFRRWVSPMLGASLLITVAVAVFVCTQGPRYGDDHVLTRQCFAMVMPVLLSLLAAAAVLVHRAYRPRLAEYRFRAS